VAVLRVPAPRSASQITTEPEIRTQDSRLRLHDGRWLGYCESGDPTGWPVLFFHGFGTTRVICPSDEAAQRLGVRLIALDRPGVGLSTPRPGRRLLDWPDDVRQAADQWGLDRFSVVGWSGGGPFALACARRLGDRIDAIAIVSGAAPLAGSDRTDYLRRFDRNAALAAGKAPWVIRLALWHWGRAQRRDAERFFEESLAEMCAADQEALSEPALRSRMIANSVELYRQGGRGMYDEALSLARPWGFDPSEIRVPVDIWHGALDTTVPVGMAMHLAQSIPGANLRLFPDEGHHLLYRCWPDILGSLMRERPATIVAPAVFAPSAGRA